jgi:serine/threonine-protein kinase
VKGESEEPRTLPPPAEAQPAKRRALLLVETEGDRPSAEEVPQSDLESDAEHATLPKLDAPPPPSASVPDRENLTGQLIDGRYQVDYVLGVGSMGVVYGARHAAVGKLVALKALRQHLADDAEAVQRFNAEATAATAIGNQHIVETFDFGKLDDGTVYLVMEYLEGRSLADLIEGWAPLAVERVVKIGLQVAEALEAAHRAGIVHRDLKPDNVFLIERGGEPDFVKILDFGIAKFGQSQARLTHAGAIFGTPAYMSPEQALGKETDGRTDVYALGVMLYEMACGRVPFQGENPLSVLALHATETPPPLSSFVADPSSELEAVIQKCLQKEPRERYQDMAELAQDLARLDSGEAVHAPPPSRSADSVRSARAGVPARGRRTWWVLPAVLMLFGSGFGAYLYLRPMPRAAPAIPSVSSPVPLPPALPSASARELVPEVEVALILFPLDARVFRGREDLGPMPVSVKVRPGEPVTVTVERDGYSTRRLTLDGSKTRVVVGLVKRDAERAAPQERPGSLPRAMEDE